MKRIIELPDFTARELAVLIDGWVRWCDEYGLNGIEHSIAEKLDQSDAPKAWRDLADLSRGVTESMRGRGYTDYPNDEPCRCGPFTADKNSAICVDPACLATRHSGRYAAAGSADVT